MKKEKSKVKYSQSRYDRIDDYEKEDDFDSIFERRQRDRRKDSPLNKIGAWLKMALMALLAWARYTKEKEGVKHFFSFENIVLFCGWACIVMSAAIVFGVFFFALFI